MEDVHNIAAGTTNRLFGRGAEDNKPSESIPGMLILSNATLAKTDRDWFRSLPEASRGDYSAGLFDTITQTAVQPEGNSGKNRSLRTIQVALPVTLHATVHAQPSLAEERRNRVAENQEHTDLPDVAPDWQAILTKACQLTRTLGSHRHRGLGRCTCTFQPHSTPDQLAS